MKDIDFDELDKAVSSLLGKPDAPTTPAASSTPPQQNSPVPATPPAATVTPTPTTPVEPSTPVQKLTVQAAPAAIGRRSGKFMDVVRPETTASTKDSAPARMSSPSGGGRKLQPINTDIRPEAKSPEPAAPKADDPVPQKMPVVNDPDPKTLISTPDTTDPVWPDPLEVGNLADEKTKEVDSETAKEEPTEKLAESLTSKEESKSPFLDNAKVEKRPLGTYAEQNKVPAADTPPLLEANYDNDTPQTPPTVPAAEEMPPELDKKLVDLEAEERHPDEASPNERPASSKTDDKPQPAVPTSMSDTPVNLAAASIPQQYKPDDRTTKTEQRPIFDTKDYHTPVTLPEHKKSGMGQWILLIILLIVALGGAAYWWVYLRY